MNEDTPDFPPLFPVGSKTIPQQFKTLWRVIAVLGMAVVILGVAVVAIGLRQIQTDTALNAWVKHWNTSAVR